ncbi:MAG: LysE family transporter [Candidatus Hodarchaeales archaeon]|jgi:threonine/homoserine/homoserine lactone efflux protein
MVLEVFIFSFLVALTGAMSPGPLLTYTIYKSLQSKRAYLVGIFIVLGHAILEFILMIILLIGFAPFISDQNVIIIIGLLGGAILVFFGASILRDIKLSNIDFSFLPSVENEVGNQSKSDHVEEADSIEHFSRHPVIGGVLISMSNPYWWLWWAVIGLAFMTQFSVSLLNQEFWEFFFGHELGDFLWYFSIATALGFTHKFITKKIYLGILVACSIFMIGFGLYLAASPLLSL